MTPSSFVATGYVANVKVVSKNLTTFALAIGVKQEDGTYKNGFVNCKVSKDASKIVDKARVTIKGFPSFEFWTSKDASAEKNKFVVVVTEVEEVK